MMERGSIDELLRSRIGLDPASVGKGLVACASLVHARG